MMLQSIFGKKQQTPAAFGRGQTQSRIKDITSTELYHRLQSGESVLLLDVRFPEEYAAGHITGARLLPLPQLRQRSGELPQDQPIVCICRSGNRSMVACEQLADQGFTNLLNLKGGMVAWSRAQLNVHG